jgi:hypothetical protein
VGENSLTIVESDEILNLTINMSKLDDELREDENVWRMWCELGVTEATPLEVDFSFYGTSKESADMVAASLRQQGLIKVEVKSSRTLWLFRGWEVLGVEVGTWSLEKLQDRTRRYVRLAELCTATYDGCGALIDTKKLKAVEPD